MTKFILGTKQNMVQFFDGSGRSFPATLICGGPVVVTQIKTKEKDGYFALQVGFGKRKEKNINKAQLGHFRAACLPDRQVAKNAGEKNEHGNPAFLKEFRLEEKEIEGIKVGDTIDVSTFTVGDKVQVTGTSKAKGFQGVVKRYGFHGGPRTHGQKHSEREPGSIGATGPQRVFKGTRMGGRMGGGRVCVKNLTVLGVDVENNKILISGAVPGRRGTFVEIKG
jgi:large subunit ribosomal protein L3